MGATYSLPWTPHTFYSTPTHLLKKNTLYGDRYHDFLDIYKVLLCTSFRMKTSFWKL
jgi:hypothetical protein